MTQPQYPAPGLGGALEDFPVGRPFGVEDTDEPALDAQQRLIGEDVVTGMSSLN